MNRAIEFHDSTVDGVSRRGADVVVSFSKAYIHKSEGEPGVDPGTGWTQEAEFILSNGSIEGELPEFPCWVSDGRVECGGRVSDNCLTLPFHCRGPAKVELVFTDGSTVTVVGENASLNLSGEATYIEDFE